MSFLLCFWKTTYFVFHYFLKFCSYRKIDSSLWPHLYIFRVPRYRQRGNLLKTSFSALQNNIMFAHKYIWVEKYEDFNENPSSISFWFYLFISYIFLIS